MLGGVRENVADDPHRRRRRINERVAHHELLEDVVLDGARQLILPHALLLCRHDIEGQNRQHRPVHRHADAHLVERNAFEQALHVFDAVNRHARLAHVALHPLMVAVVAPMRGQVKRHAQAFLACREVPAVKRVALLGCRESRVLPHRPRSDRVHRRIRPAQVRRHARPKRLVRMLLSFVRDTKLRGPSLSLDRLAEWPFGGMVQREEARFGILRPRLVAACHVRRDVPRPREVGALPFDRPRLHQVRTGAPTSRRLHLLVAGPGLLRHLTRQRFDRTAALHHVGVLAKPGFLAQDVLDVAGPALSAHGLFAVLPPLHHLPEIVAPDFQPVHAPEHRGVSRHGVAEQRVAGMRSVGVESERRGLGFKPHHGATRHAHRSEQPRPQGAGCAGHRHVRQHVSTEGEAQRGVLRRVFKRPPGRHKHVQGLFRGTEHGAERVDGKHAAVLPFGRVHAPHVKRRHRRVPRLCVQRQRLRIKFILAPRIPRARTAHHLPFRPRHHGTQRPHGVVAIHVKRHHLRVHVSEQRPERLAIHPFGQRSDAFNPVHEALHHQGFLRKALLNLPPPLRPGSYRHLHNIHRLNHHLRNAHSVPAHVTHHVLLASGSRLPTVHRPRRKLRCVHAPEIKVIRFAP